MAFSLVNTLSNTTGKGAYFSYLVDTFLPTVGWTTAAHPDSDSQKRVLNRSYTNQLTGNTLTTYFWINWGITTPQFYKDSTYTTVPGDLGTSTSSGGVGLNYTSNPFSGNAYKFWSSSVNSSASMVTRGKYVIWLDLGVDDVFAYEQTGWSGGTSNATHFLPFNYTLSGMKYCSAPLNPGTISTTGYLTPNHEGQTIGTDAGVDSIIKGWSMLYGDNGVNSRLYGVSYHLTGDEIVLHVPGTGGLNNSDIVSPGAVVQNGSDYYYRLSSDMTSVSPMLNMGTSEPDFS